MCSLGWEELDSASAGTAGLKEQCVSSGDSASLPILGLNYSHWPEWKHGIIIIKFKHY